MKGEVKSPKKSAAVYTTATKKPPATKTPPTKMPLTITAGRKYTNWKQEPGKSKLARSVEAKLTGLDTQLAVGNIIIPDGTLQYHVRYAKYEANNNGVSLIFHEGETKMFTTKLYRVNIQQLIPL